MVSHELRTPLTVIMGSIELASMQMDLRRSSLAPEAEELINQIEKGLTNYLTNALRYAPVEMPIRVYLEVDRNNARVSVCDQGPGLTAEQQQRVWERFYQAAAPGQRGPDRGMGLGLAIAKAIIEQHHGQVGVESTPGHGATFWFTLPSEISSEARPLERS